MEWIELGWHLLLVLYHLDFMPNRIWKNQVLYLCIRHQIRKIGYLLPNVVQWMLDFIPNISVNPWLVLVDFWQYMFLVVDFLKQHVERNWHASFRICWTQLLDNWLEEQDCDEIPICISLYETMWVIYQSVNHILVCKYCSILNIVTNVYQNLLYDLIAQYMVLIIPNKIFWIHRENVNKTLYPIWEEIIWILYVVKTIWQHPRMFNHLWDFTCVDVNHVSGIVHNVISKNCPYVIRNLGKHIPHLFCGCVLPFLVLDIVPQQRSEFKLVGEWKICSIKLL